MVSTTSPMPPVAADVTRENRNSAFMIAVCAAFLFIASGVLVTWLANNRIEMEGLYVQETTQVTIIDPATGTQSTVDQVNEDCVLEGQLDDSIDPTALPTCTKNFDPFGWSWMLGAFSIVAPAGYGAIVLGFAIVSNRWAMGGILGVYTAAIIGTTVWIVKSSENDGLVWPFFLRGFLAGVVIVAATVIVALGIFFRLQQISARHP